MTSKRVLGVLFVGTLLLVSFFIFKPRLVDNFLFRYEEIDVQPLYIRPVDDPDGKKPFVPPGSSFHIGVQISEKKAGLIKFNFEEPISFDAFSFLFIGNLHSVSSYLAEDFDVYYQGELDSWKRIDEVRGNTSAFYRFYSPTTISTDSIKILVSKAPFTNTASLHDLNFYRKQKLGLIGGVRNFFWEQRKSFSAYLFYSFFFYILLLIPGYTILDLVKKRWPDFKDSEHKTVFAPIVSIIILFLIALFYLLIGNPRILDFYWLVFFISFFVFLKKRLYREIFFSKSPLLLMGTVFIIMFLIQARRDYLFSLPYIEPYLDKLKFIPLRGGYYGYHGDNTLQWGISRLLLDRVPISAPSATDYLMDYEPKAIFDRTPVLPMITMVFLRLFGKSHFIYQRFLNVLAALYYGAAYLAVRRFFSKHTAKIVGLLMLLSVQLTYYSFNAEIYLKYFAMYPVFLIFALISKKTGLKSGYGDLVIGLLMAIAFFIHPFVLIFMTVLFFICLKEFRISKKYFVKSVAIFSPTLVLLCSWALFSNYLKQKSGLNLSQSKNIYIDRLSFFQLSSLLNKLINILNVFLPNVLLRGITKGPGSYRQFLVPFLRFSLISVMTPFFFFSGLILFKRKFLKKHWKPFWLGIGPTIVLLLVLHNYSAGEHATAYQFSLPLLLGLVVNRLSLLSLKKRLLIFATYPLFMLAPLYFFSGLFTEIQFTSLAIHGLFWGTILSYGFLSLLLIKIGANNGR